MMKLVQKIAVAYLRIKFRILSAISPGKTAEQAFNLFSTPQRRTVGELPGIFSKAATIRLDFDKFHITGYQWNKGAGPKALIIHGFESSAINFEQYVQPLLDKGYEVLAFDAPAHGRSSGKQMNALIYRNFIQYIEQHFGPVQFFIAHSFGGLALCLALAELEITLQRKLVLIAPVTETVSSINIFFDFFHLKNPHVRQEFDKLIVRIGGQPLAWFSIGRTLTNLPYPILWLHDEDDLITPLADARKIKEQNLANIRFVITKGLGHRRIYRDEEMQKRVIDFA
jgi:pimeloyl-ACP methyl ester carboxylesterase